MTSKSSLLTPKQITVYDIDPSVVFQPNVFKNIIEALIKIENKKNPLLSSLDKVVIIRNLGMVSRLFHKLTQDLFSDCYNLIFFFKGLFPASTDYRNSLFFNKELNQIPTTNRFWIIPRPKTSKTFGRIETNHIRFTHFCLESDYDYLKTCVFPKEFKDGKYPQLTDAIYEPKTTETFEETEKTGESEETGETENSEDAIIQKIMVRLKRIRRGKVKKVTL